MCPGLSHPVQLNDIRCFPSSFMAIADGKWELRLASGGTTSRTWDGARSSCHRPNGGWAIEAWRYTVDPPANTTPAPTILKKPGWPGGPGGA